MKTIETMVAEVREFEQAAGNRNLSFLERSVAANKANRERTALQQLAAESDSSWVRYTVAACLSNAKAPR